MDVAESGKVEFGFCAKCDAVRIFRDPSPCACGCLRTAVTPVAQWQTVVLANMGLVGMLAAEFELRLGSRIARKLGGKRDLRNEGMLALVRAAQHYRPESGFAFSTYACQAIKNQISLYVTMWLRHKRNVRLEVCLDDVPEEDDVFEDAATAWEVARRDELYDLPRLVAGLEPRRRQAIEAYYLQDRIFEDVAAHMGVTKQRASQLAEDGVVRLLKAYGDKEGYRQRKKALKPETLVKKREYMKFYQRAKAALKRVTATLSKKNEKTSGQGVGAGVG